MTGSTLRRVRTHSSLAYAGAWEDPLSLFGAKVPPEFLIGRVRTCSWEKSYTQLAHLAAKVAHHGFDSEEIRLLTVDPLLQLTGDLSAGPIISAARKAVSERRNDMILAHEQAISFLQHLVLMEGGDSNNQPLPPEMSLWLACSGAFLGRWQQAEEESCSEEHALIAELSTALRFNNEADPVRTLVRTARLFANQPTHGELSATAAWESLKKNAFGGDYDEFFDSVLGTLFMLSRMWGDKNSRWPEPEIDMSLFLKETSVDPMRFQCLMETLSADRATLSKEARQRTIDGLPHAPTALLYHPFVRMGSNRFVAASPWAVLHQVRFAPWAQLLRSAKGLCPKRSPNSWFRAFGGQLESWCRRLATEAERSPTCRAKFHMPKVPGGADEVEDVVLTEGRAVVLFSVKSRVMEAGAAREAISVSKTMHWYKSYFFEEKGDDYRGGAIRQIDARIRMIQEGRFESQGIMARARILPVIVTYDGLGESDALYKWLEAQCVTEGLLQGSMIGPITLARIDEFEDLMARTADGKSVVELLRRREHADRYRRLDQIIYEHALPRKRRRLPFFNQDWNVLTTRIRERLFRKGGPGPETACP